jgi:hypothetical protein
LLAPQNFSKINEKADYKSGGFRIGWLLFITQKIKDCGTKYWTETFAKMFSKMFRLRRTTEETFICKLKDGWGVGCLGCLVGWFCGWNTVTCTAYHSQ